MSNDHIKMEGGASGAAHRTPTPSPAAYSYTPAHYPLLAAVAVDPFGPEAQRRGVVPFLEYAHFVYAKVKLTKNQNLAKYGTAKNPPPPTPLFLDETEEEYEREFQHWLAVRKVPTDHLPVQNRSYRLDFANRRVAWYRGDPPRKPLLEQPKIELDIADAPREQLYTTAHVALKEYKLQLQCGFFDGLSKLSRTQIYDRFGTVLPPIYAPLKSPETPQQYEERFVKWLEMTESTSLEELAKHPDPLEERKRRVRFAALSGSGKQTSARLSKARRKRNANTGAEPPAKKMKTSEDVEEGEVMEVDEERSPNANPSQQLPETTPRKPVDPPESKCPGGDSVEACITCGCKLCLVRGFQLVNEMEASVEREARQDDASPMAASIAALVLSRPTTEDLHSRIAGRLSASAKERVQSTVDPIERKLTSDYESINAQVVASEKVLEASATRLALAPVTNLEETNRLLRGNQQKQELIESEIVRRNTALCALIVYIWRHQTNELSAMVNDANATNVPRVQRVAHHKCGHILTEIKKKRKTVEDLKTQIDSIMARESTDGRDFQTTNAALAQLGTLLTTAENDLRQLGLHQRQEFATLIRCDEHVRSEINHILLRP